MKGEYYKNKYVIVVSETNDLEYIVAIFDNVMEMAKEFNRTLTSMRSVITRVYQGKKDHLMYRGKKHNVEFLSISALNSEL
jgi:hypothetical protein